MKMWIIRQNNSRGVFYGTKYAAVFADTVKEAEVLFERLDGVYLDTFDDYCDCECCGVRWAFYGAGDSDAVDIDKSNPKKLVKDLCDFLNMGTDKYQRRNVSIRVLTPLTHKTRNYTLHHSGTLTPIRDVCYNEAISDN